MREEALAAVEGYSATCTYDLSTLSLVSIILPEKNPLKNVPRIKFTPWIHEICCESTFECSFSETVLETLQNFFYGIGLVIGYVIRFIYCCWCNFPYIVDSKLDLTMHEKLYLVQTIFLVYSSGVVIYERPLRRILDTRHWFVWHDYGYEERIAWIKFVPWSEIDFTVMKTGLHKDDEFVYVSLAGFIMLHKEKVFEQLLEYKKRFLSDSPELVSFHIIKANSHLSTCIDILRLALYYS
eukprot:snap_masked-scaffold_56-processed-gene-1.24-mRNA-1 protein AED:1.00 eAED:1.00 QI:0/0/0/0/1/1/2/0/238